MAETTFFNVWSTDSRENQEALVSAMRSETKIFAAKPGFLSLTGWVGQDNDHRVIAEARWASRAHFEAAVADNPEAIAGRLKLEKLGTPAAGLFHEGFRVQPETLQVARGSGDGAVALREAAGERWRALGFESKMVSIGNVDLFVATGGSGQPLLLLHGYPQCGEIWRHVGPELAKTHHVIIPDLKGMGLSGITSDGYDLPKLADDIHQLVTRLGFATLDVAGHDWGGAVAAVYALRYRSEVRRFAFIESAVGGAGFESLWAFTRPNSAMAFIPFVLLDGLAESLVVGREEPFLHHLWNTFTHNKERLPFADWQPYVDAMRRPGLMRSSASYYRSVYGAAERIQELVQAGKLTIPVLSVSGEASFGPNQKAFVEPFASQIVGPVIIRNAGHFVAEEQPEVLLAEFHQFFGD